MKELREFNIEIYSLRTGSHDYEFKIGETFFEYFNYGLVDGGDCSARVQLNKSETLIEAYFEIKGSVELTCDRSLETFDFPINISEKMLFKFGEQDQELSENIQVIERNTQRLNMAQYIYEFIGVAVPMKKIHPRFNDQYNEADEENVLVYSSAESEQEFKEESSEEIDPRWNALNKLKDNNK